MMPPPKGFSWSASRGRVLEDCPRAYFFQYYLALGRVETGDRERIREAKRLKKLKTVPMWIGSSVHDAVEKMLREARDGQPADLDRSIDEMIATMRRDYRESFGDVSGGTRFLEHEYGHDVPNERWRRDTSDAKAMVSAFSAMPYLEEVRAAGRERLLALENLEQWYFEGVPIWVRIDLAYRAADGEVHILDWKTGRMQRGQNPLQMTGYAAYAEKAWGVAPEELAVREVYLRQADDSAEKWCTIDAGALEEARNGIRASVDEMLQLLRDPKSNVAHEPDFEPLPEPRKCGRCFFQGICPASAAERA